MTLWFIGRLNAIAVKESLSEILLTIDFAKTPDFNVVRAQNAEFYRLIDLT